MVFVIVALGGLLGVTLSATVGIVAVMVALFSCLIVALGSGGIILFPS
jgi:hypothetical protein